VARCDDDNDDTISIVHFLAPWVSTELPPPPQRQILGKTVRDFALVALVSAERVLPRITSNPHAAGDATSSPPQHALRPPASVAGASLRPMSHASRCRPAAPRIAAGASAALVTQSPPGLPVRRDRYGDPVRSGAFSAGKELAADEACIHRFASVTRRRVNGGSSADRGGTRL